MQVIALRRLRDFWRDHPRAEPPLRAWYALVSKAEWASPADIGRMFGAADVVAGNRVIFDIGGDQYRIVAQAAYRHHRVLIHFVGLHKDYDRIAPEAL